MKRQNSFARWLKRTEAAYQQYLKDRVRLGQSRAYKLFYTKIPK